MKKLLLFVSALLIVGTSYSQLHYSDVASIFYSNCTSCHNNHSNASSFLTYSQTAALSVEIRTNLNAGLMPPWLPDTIYSRFSHERIISPADKAAIISWINSGALSGDTSLAPAPPVYSEYQLRGAPDLELRIPTFTSNASSDDSYVCFSLPTGLTQDRIVRAYEIVAGNPEIVHHVIANVDTLGTTTSNLTGSCYTITGDFSLGGYAPGAPPTVFPGSGQLKMGITIKAGSKIVLQFHYPIGTAGQIDSTKIRLYFYPIGTTGVRPVFVSTPLQNWLLNIPANTVRTFTATYPLSGGIPLPISIFGTFPHSHKIATHMLNCAYMGTDTIPLVKINRWDFNWQGYYTFRSLVKIPAGYKLFSSHFYDNTPVNPFITGTPVNTIAGTSTSDEMLFDSFQWLLYQSGDELINIDSILAMDPLFTGIRENLNTGNNINTSAYPNPFEKAVNISYALKKQSIVLIEIYSMQGRLVRTLLNNDETPGSHEIKWDGKNNDHERVASGVYIYIIKSGDESGYGKITLLPGSGF